MPIKQPNDFDWLTMMILLFFSSVGAVAKMAFDIINGAKITLMIFVCQVIVSLFAGGLALLVASLFDMSFESTGCLAGAAGWLGAEFIKVIVIKIQKKVEDT